MNKRDDEIQDDYKSLLLMSELEPGEPISQREISNRLGIALGLVNSYLKNLVQKGYVTVKSYPRNRYAYLLTPKGFSEKSRLAFKHLGHFTRLYNSARKDFQVIFLNISRKGFQGVVFCGVDETAEIAFLSLQEAGLELISVLDSKIDGSFFGHAISLLEQGIFEIEDTPIVLTSYYRGAELKKSLLDLGVPATQIYELGKVA